MQIKWEDLSQEIKDKALKGLRDGFSCCGWRQGKATVTFNFTDIPKACK